MKCIIDKVLRSADDYLEKMTWKDMAVLKICLIALGITIGCSLSKEKGKKVKKLALFVFVVTYIPLMYRYLPCLKNWFCNPDE